MKKKLTHFFNYSLKKKKGEKKKINPADRKKNKVYFVAQP